MTINERQNEIIEEFDSLDDWIDKYQMLIDLGGELEALPEQYKTDQNLIDGCQSRVWVYCETSSDENGVKVMHLQADSDALIVKGIVALLLRVLNDQRPEDVLNADLYFIDRIGLHEHLSPTRSNGLLAMIQRIRACALSQIS
ncbi:MAG: SufE family protein [Prevotella sp.]|nr:SufE family protein [Prevotella sp.]